VSTPAALLLLAVGQAAPAQDRVDVWTTHPLENVFRNATKPQRATTTSRVESTSGSDGLESVSFRNADDGSKALIVVNTAVLDRSFAVRWAGRSLTYVLPGGSVVTLAWN